MFLLSCPSLECVLFASDVPHCSLRMERLLCSSLGDVLMGSLVSLLLACLCMHAYCWFRILRMGLHSCVLWPFCPECSDVDRSFHQDECSRHERIRDDFSYLFFVTCPPSDTLVVSSFFVDFPLWRSRHGGGSSALLTRAVFFSAQNLRRCSLGLS